MFEKELLFQCPPTSGAFQTTHGGGDCEVFVSKLNLSSFASNPEIGKEMIHVYPNPTRDNVTISMSSESAKIEVIDIQGKLLDASTIQNGGLVSLANYDRGVYFLRITAESGTSLHRVVKN